LSAERGGSQTRSQEGRAGSGVGDREGRTGLEDRDAADRPVGKQDAPQAFGIPEEGQIVAVTDDEAMRAVEIGKAAGILQIGFVVKRGVERGVAARSGVGRPRESICSLKIAPVPTARDRRLKRVIV